MTPLGSPVRFAELPTELRVPLTGLRQRGPDPAGGARWFANGDEVSLGIADAVRRAAPALFMLAAAGLGIFAWDTLADGHALGFAWAAGAVAFVVAAIVAGISASSRASNAARRFDLGTWLLPDTLVLVTYGRYVPLPRSCIVRAGIDVLGKGGEREEIVSVFYRDHRDHGDAQGREKTLHLTGFRGDPAAIAALHEWVRAAP